MVKTETLWFEVSCMFTCVWVCLVALKPFASRQTLRARERRGNHVASRCKGVLMLLWAECWYNLLNTALRQVIIIVLLTCV